MVDLPSTATILANISSTSVPFFTDLLEIALPITGIVLAGIVAGGIITMLTRAIRGLIGSKDED